MPNCFHSAGSYVWKRYERRDLLRRAIHSGGAAGHKDPEFLPGMANS